MGSTYSEKIIISVGGSLIVPNGGIDTNFVTSLNNFIRNQLATNKNRQFFLVIGGGATARHYRDAARTVIGQELAPEDEDWLGIHSTRLNAHLIRTVFRDIAHAAIIEHYDVIRKPSEPLVIASGWKPGWSTDYLAMLLYQDYGGKNIINLSNIDKVYDSDPKINPNAKAIEKISWADFRQIVGDAWSPGLNTPFDPIAAKKAEEIGAKVVIINGKNFENLEKCLNGEEFIGTVIE